MLAVPGKEKRTGTLETLLGQDLLIRFQGELGVLHAIGPEDGDYVGGALLSQAEMQLGRGDGLLLQQQAGT